MFRLSDFRGRTGSLMTTFVLVAAGLLTVPALAEAVPGRYPTTAYSTLGVTALGLALFGGGVALSLLGRRPRPLTDADQPLAIFAEMT